MAIFRLGLGFGAVNAPGVQGPDVFERISEVSVVAEESGFDALFVPDHVWQNDRGGTGRDAPMLEAYTLLGAIAARTKRAKLGALVSPVTFRNPAILAKTVTTVDVISHGRAILGLGAAWDDGEHLGYDIEFPPVGERMDRLEEALQICRAMFDEPSPSFVGRYYEIHEALNVPRPESEHLPILVGGGGEARTLLAVARYADACNVFGDAETVRHKFDVLKSHCDAVGRDINEITKTAAVPFAASPAAMRESAEALRAVGVDGVIVAGPFPSIDQVRAVGEALSATFG
jgi:F420-dependent oxidoreductase-like protein